MREDMKCLRCGETEQFDIAITCWATTWPYGTGRLQGIEWDAESAAICGNCQTEDTVGGFSRKFDDHIKTLRALEVKAWPAIHNKHVIGTTPIDGDYEDVLNDARREQD